MTRSDPRLVAVPVTALTFALASLALQLGVPGLVGGAIIGTLWSLLLGVIARRLAGREGWGRPLANTPLLLAIVATGLLIGGGLMYGFLMRAALSEPSTTPATMSALMQPTIPYFIVVNTLMETLIIPLALFANWQVPKRRPLVLSATLVFFAMRVWSYLTFVPRRFEIAGHALSPADLEWFRETMATDYRGLLVIITHVLFILAAFVPAAIQSQSEP
jgi:hypothetical protein